jgi:hypothetical protein
MKKIFGIGTETQTVGDIGRENCECVPNRAIGLLAIRIYDAA